MNKNFSSTTSADDHRNLKIALMDASILLFRSWQRNYQHD